MTEEQVKENEVVQKIDELENRFNNLQKQIDSISGYIDDRIADSPGKDLYPQLCVFLLENHYHITTLEYARKIIKFFEQAGWGPKQDKQFFIEPERLETVIYGLVYKALPIPCENAEKRAGETMRQIMALISGQNRDEQQDDGYGKESK